MDSNLDKETTAGDPFAGDIFASPKDENWDENSALPQEQIKIESQAERADRWFKQLPAVQPANLFWDELRLNLAPEFSDNLTQHLAGTLTQYLTSSAGINNIEFRPLVSREINRREDFSAASSYWLTVGIGPAADDEAVVEIEEAFAVWLVDAAIGADSARGARVRELTPSETAVLEFLMLNMSHETNQLLNAPLFRFRSLSKQIPEWLRRNVESDKPSLLVTGWQTMPEVMPSIVKIYLTSAAAKALQSGENTSAKKKSKLLSERVKTVKSRWLVDDAKLSLGEYATLEISDVILLENRFALSDTHIAGTAEIYLGADETAKIVGEIYSDNLSSFMGLGEPAAAIEDRNIVRHLDSRQVLQIKIKDVQQIENSLTQATKNIMAEEENALASAAAEENNAAEQPGSGLAVEDLAVNLRIELDARQLSLAEVSNLRENQTLDLGIRPTDEVNLMLDNRIVGRGELVAVADRLGVRITKLLR